LDKSSRHFLQRKALFIFSCKRTDRTIVQLFVSRSGLLGVDVLDRVQDCTRLCKRCACKNPLQIHLGPKIDIQGDVHARSRCGELESLLSAQNQLQFRFRLPAKTCIKRQAFVVPCSHRIALRRTRQDLEVFRPNTLVGLHERMRPRP
jgi:hypothetical protein